MNVSESKFSFYNPPVDRVNYVKEANLYGIYRYIVDPKYAKQQTDTLRTLGGTNATPLSCVGESGGLGRFNCSEGASLRDQRTERENARKRYKATHFAYCLFSGTFARNRRNDGLMQHSGLICIDFDHVNPDELLPTLLSDPYFETLLSFRSPSGDGRKWVISIDLQKATHEQWYTAISNYLRATYCLQADPACKNVARACFLPHDPECYIAPRLHRDLEPTINENPAIAELMRSIGATNICITPKNDENV